MNNETVEVSYTFPIDKNLLAFATAVARALEAIEVEGDLDYYVSRVEFAYDGDSAGVRVEPNDLGGYDVTVQR